MGCVPFSPILQLFFRDAFFPFFPSQSITNVGRKKSLVGNLVPADFLSFFCVIKDDTVQLCVEVDLLSVKFVFKLHVNSRTSPFVFGAWLKLQLNRWDSLPGFSLRLTYGLASLDMDRVTCKSVYKIRIHAFNRLITYQALWVFALFLQKLFFSPFIKL